jgi:hypothetical protein
LPKDTATFFLNPAGNALALAIRQAKGQARQNCVAMPQEVVATLSAFFPGDLFPGVCWTVAGNGFNLANISINDGNMRYFRGKSAPLQKVEAGCGAASAPLRCAMASLRSAALGGNCGGMSGAKELQEGIGKSAGEWHFTLRGR